VVET